MFSNVKNTVIYGHGASVLTVGDNTENKISSNKSIEISDTILENKIKEMNPKFNLKDYTKQVSDGLYVCDVNTGEKRHIYSYIDYTFKIGDYMTNLGYTVVLNNNGSVANIIDNTKDLYSSLQYDKLKEISNKTIKEEDCKYYIEKAKENIKNEKVIDDEVTFLYDVENNKKYACVVLKIEDELIDSKQISYKFEIK